MDDITALLKRRNKEFAELAERVLEKLKKEVEKKGLELPITEGSKEDKNKVIAPCRYLEEKLREGSKRKGVVVVDLRTQTKHLGAKEKAMQRKIFAQVT